MVMGKAERTRQHIQTVAVDLFERQGYERTTVEEIARAAGLSHMTFFRHFPSKERVVLDDPFDPAIAAAVAAAPRDLAPVPRICAGFRLALSQIELPPQREVRTRIRIAAGVPSLTAGMWANTATTQEVIAGVLVSDETPPVDAAVAAGAVLGALTVALLAWAADKRPGRRLHHDRPVACRTRCRGEHIVETCRRSGPMSAAPLVCRGLRRTFGPVAALDGLDLDVPAGQVTAIVGLNGAGKTTLMRAALGMCRIDTGSVEVFGHRPDRAPSSCWRRVGYLVESPFAYPDLTVAENLVAAARLHGVDRRQAGRVAAASINRLDLVDYADRPAGRLSLGNRQRLGIAAALAHQPDLVILDEPTNALDPAGVVLIRDLVTELAGNGAAVLVSSHHLDEVARVAGRILVVHRGRTIGELDPSGNDLERRFFEMAHTFDTAHHLGREHLREPIDA